jgi:class 3 adenylate cyclase
MRVGSIPLGEVLAILCAQGADLRVGAFLADLAGRGRILISGAVVEAAGQVSFCHQWLAELVWTPM